MDKYNEFIDQIVDVMLSRDENDLEEAMYDVDPSLTHIPLANKTKFLKDVGQKLQEAIEQGSSFRIDNITNLIQDQNADSNYGIYMSSRLMSSNLEKLFKASWIKDNKDFIDVLRDVQLSALRTDRNLAKQFSELLKGGNEETGIGLITKKSIFLLDGEMNRIRCQRTIDKLSQEMAELDEERKNGEIDVATHVKQRNIKQAKFEAAYLAMETNEKFTDFNVCALQYKADKAAGKINPTMKEQSVEARNEYNKLAIEESLKQDEISYLEGDISLAEYQEAEKQAQQQLDMLEKRINARTTNANVNSGKTR